MLSRGTSLNGYSIVEEIGQGEFGKVLLAKNSGGMSFAIKTIPLPNIAHNPSLQSFLAQETAILLRLNHPNIVEFFEEFQHENLLCIVYEYCEKGTASKALKEQGSLEEPAALLIFKEVLSALQELEQCGIIHRDIKPENILLKSSKVKLADFGLSTYTNLRHKRMVGSPMYMAPESLHLFEYSHKSDIYSLGMTLYRLLTGKFPFKHDQLEGLLALKYEFRLEQLPDHISWPAKLILASCLTPNPQERPRAADLISQLSASFPKLSNTPLDSVLYRSPAPKKWTNSFQPHNNNNQIQVSFAHPQANPLQFKFGGVKQEEQRYNPNLNLSGTSQSRNQNNNNISMGAIREIPNQVASPLHRRYSNPYQSHLKQAGTHTPTCQKEIDFSNYSYPHREGPPQLQEEEHSSSININYQQRQPTIVHSNSNSNYLHVGHYNQVTTSKPNSPISRYFNDPTGTGRNNNQPPFAYGNNLKY